MFYLTMGFVAVWLLVTLYLVYRGYRPPPSEGHKQSLS